MCCGPSGPSPQQQAQQQSQINWQALLDSARLNQINQYTPTGSRTYTGAIGSPDRTERVELTPEMQRIFEGQTRVTQGMTDASQRALDRLGTNQFDLTQGAVDVRRAGPQDFQTSFDQGPGLRYGFDNGGELTRGASSRFGITNQIADAGPLQRQVADVGGPQRYVDLSGLTAIPGASDFGAERSRVEDALYGRQRRFIDPDMAEQKQGLETQLINQGFTPGTEGYQKALESFGRTREMTLGNARDSAIAAAGGEQGRLFGQGLQSRQQQVAERFGTGEFGNSAQAQAYLQALGSGQFVNQAQQQQFGQNAARADFGNRAQAQDFGQLFQNAQLNNAAAMQDYQRNQGQAQFYNDTANSQFARNMSEAEFANAARGMQGQYGLNLQNADQSWRQQQTGENLTSRNQQYQELAALLGGSPIQPSSPGYTQFDPRAQYNMAQAAPDVMGGYASQNAARAAILGSIFGAAGQVGSAGITRCWVAREVYGETNLMWLLFREWLDERAPKWFRALYLKFGERFANFISDKPALKSRIRAWMDARIAYGK